FLRYKVAGLTFLDMPAGVNDQLDLLREVNDRGLTAVLAAFPKPLGRYLNRTDHYEKGMLARVEAIGREELDHLADHAAALLAVAPVRELVLAAGVDTFRVGPKIDAERKRAAKATLRVLDAVPPGRAAVTVVG